MLVAFLERNAAREAALAWKDGLREVRRLRTLDCPKSTLDAAWTDFGRRDLPKLSAPHRSS